MDSRAPHIAAEPQQTGSETPAPVWGAAATFAWTLLIAIVFTLVQGISLILYLLLIIRAPDRAAADAVVSNLRFDGVFVAFYSFATLLVCVPVIMGVAKLKRGSNVKDYLGLRWPPLKELLRWSLIILGFCLVADGLWLLLRQPTVPEPTTTAYITASPRWLPGLALVIAAPIFEEICFRGFIFKGLASSRLRWQGATVITALLWAGIHQQYNWFWITVLFGAGLLLGTARAMTHSTLLTIWLHGLVNALIIAQIEFALLQR